MVNVPVRYGVEGDREVEEAFRRLEAQAASLGERIAQAGEDGAQGLDRATRALADVERGFEGVAGRAKGAADATRDLGSEADAAGARLGTVLGGAIVAGTTAMIAFTAQGIASVARLRELSEQTGIGIARLQAWEDGTRRAGGQQKAFNEGLVQFSRLWGQALDGNDRAIERFRALGIGMEDVTGKTKTVEQAAIDVVEALSRIENQSQRLSQGRGFFGGEFRRMQEFAEQGEDGLRRFEQAFADSGAGITAQQAADLKTLEQQWDQFFADTEQKARQWAARNAGWLGEAMRIGGVVRDFALSAGGDLDVVGSRGTAEVDTIRATQAAERLGQAYAQARADLDAYLASTPEIDRAGTVVRHLTGEVVKAQAAWEAAAAAVAKFSQQLQAITVTGPTAPRPIPGGVLPDDPFTNPNTLPAPRPTRPPGGGGGGADPAAGYKRQQEALEDYLRTLEREDDLLRLTERERAIATEGLKAEKLATDAANEAKKAGITLDGDYIANARARAEVAAAARYDQQQANRETQQAEQRALRESERIQDQYRKRQQDAWADFYMMLTDTSKKGWKGFFDSWLQQSRRMESQDFASFMMQLTGGSQQSAGPMGGGFGGGLGSGGGFGGGSPFNMLFGALGQIFGGGTSLGAPGGGATSFSGSDMSSLFSVFSSAGGSGGGLMAGGGGLAGAMGSGGGMAGGGGFLGMLGGLFGQGGGGMGGGMMGGGGGILGMFGGGGGMGGAGASAGGGFMPFIGGAMNIGGGILQAQQGGRANQIAGYGRAVGGALQMIPTPWTQAAGAIIQIGSQIAAMIVGNKKVSPQSVSAIEFDGARLPWERAQSGWQQTRDKGNTEAAVTGSDAVSTELNRFLFNIGATLDVAAGTRLGYVGHSTGRTTGAQYFGGLGDYASGPANVDGQRLKFSEVINAAMDGREPGGNAVEITMGSSAEETVSRVLGAIIQEAATNEQLISDGSRFFSQSIATALRNANEDADLEELQSAVTTARLFDEMIELGRAGDGTRDSIEDLRQQIRALEFDVGRFGLSVEELREAETRGMRAMFQSWGDGISDELLGMTDPAALARLQNTRQRDADMADLQAWLDEAVITHQEYWTKVEEINKTYAEREKAIQEQFQRAQIDGLQDFYRRLTYGDLSGEGAQRQIEGAEAGFADAFARASAPGATQADIERFLRAGEQYSVLSLQVNGIGGRFRDNRDTVTAAVMQILNQQGGAIPNVGAAPPGTSTMTNEQLLVALQQQQVLINDFIAEQRRLNSLLVDREAA
jgi:hypothetical protein